MSDRLPFPGDALAEAGLNRQFVFDLADLPDETRLTLGNTSSYRQLILLGHGGKRLWERVRAVGLTSEHPIDDYTVRVVDSWLAEQLPGRAYRIIYPGEQPVGLQALGKLAGWHHTSPFMVGIDAEWGSWYAYRAAVLIDFQFQTFSPINRESPCNTCLSKPCISACPADALAGGSFALGRCSSYRLSENSACATSCLARETCPVGAQHRYDKAQLAHSYGRSLAMIREFAARKP
jgi:epoxyqueuosine reductase